MDNDQPRDERAEASLGAPQDPAPARLTRKALFELELEEMRQRGEPSEAIEARAQFAPESTASDLSQVYRELHERTHALILAGHGILYPESWKERQRKEREGLLPRKRGALPEDWEAIVAWKPRRRSPTPPPPPTREELRELGVSTPSTRSLEERRLEREYMRRRLAGEIVESVSSETQEIEEEPEAPVGATSREQNTPPYVASSAGSGRHESRGRIPAQESSGKAVQSDALPISSRKSHGDAQDGSRHLASRDEPYYTRSGRVQYYSHWQEHSEDARAGSDWKYRDEMARLKDEMLEAARHRPDERELFRTFDMQAFIDEFGVPDTRGQPPVSSNAIEGEPTPDTRATPSDIPADLLPPHRTVVGAVELGSYLASSSYVVSLGGPPLPDLKYGIIIVPAGEESLLFEGHGDQAVMPAGWQAEVRDKSRAVRRELAKEAGAKEVEPGVWVQPIQEAELDDDEREFLRRRRMERLGLDVTAPVVPESAKAHSTDGERSDRGLRLTEEPARSEISRGQPAVDAVILDPMKTSVTQNINKPEEPPQEPSPVGCPGSETVAGQGPGTACPEPSSTGHLPGAPQEGQETTDVCPSAAPIHQIPVRDYVNGPEPEPTPSINKTATRTPTNLDASEPERGQVLSDNDTPPRTPTPSDPETARTATAATETLPLSQEARLALEVLLGAGGEAGRRKSNSKRQALASLLSPSSLRRRSLSTPSRNLSPQGGTSAADTIMKAAVLLEVSSTLSRIARGELSENPGIDPRIWKDVRDRLESEKVPVVCP